jgi:hypothetical protein
MKEYVSLVERYWQGKIAVLGVKYRPDSLSSPQIPRELNLNLTPAILGESKTNRTAFCKFCFIL